MQGGGIVITSCVISTTEDEHEDELNLFKSQTRGATCGAELTSNVRTADRTPVSDVGQEAKTDRWGCVAYVSVCGVCPLISVSMDHACLSSMRPGASK